MDNPFIYIVINGELKMSPGKAAAQAVHAAAMLQGIHDFSREIKRTVIVLEAKNTQQLMNLRGYLSALNIPSEYYIDEGVNEVDVYSVTALAVGPIEADDLEKREILAPFPLFPKKEKKRGFFKRKR